MATAAETLTSAPTPTPTPGTTATTTTGMPTAPGWWDTVKDGEVKGWLQNKNYPDAESALKAHWGLERLMGAEKAGRTVLLPKDENDSEGWKALVSKLGVPQKSDDYKLPMPEGVDDGFAKTASGWFHEAGVPPKMAKYVAEKWNSWVAEQVKVGEESDKAESQKQMGALEKEWGGEFTAKRELAQRGYRDFAKQFGLDDKAALERAESVLGAANLTKFFAGLGSLNAETPFAGSDGKGGFSMTPADAQKEVSEITAKRSAGQINDYQWRTEYLPRMLKLGEIIASGSA
jgi:hypothetical protein